ncbi:MAG: 2-oxoglutarate dehydrogenase complex dihydrolipoyllysine-residue succinyltransferase [bacterium]
MAIDLKAPSPGESITEVTIGEWLKRVGDHVEADEPLVVVESDKVNLEVPAPQAGTLTEIVKGAGETVRVGDVIGRIEAGDGASAGDATAKAAADDGAEAKEDAEAKEGDKGDEEPNGGDGESPRVTPAARRLLAEHGLGADQVEATGPGGRLLKEDVLRHVERGGDAAAKADDKGKAAEKAAEPAERPKADKPKAAEAPKADKPKAAERSAEPAGERGEERVRMSPLRRTVARRLVEAQQNAALLTTFNEIDMSAVMELRQAHRDAFVERYDVKLGFMSFFVKAVVDALKQFPAINARIDGDEVVYHDYCDIGVAVGGGKGLVVPVIRDAERLSFAEIEKTINDFGARARDNKLKLEELTGGTFSITNGGVYGSLLSTPIINPPQSGILGMHGIQDRPVALNGQVVIRPMMYVALTYDHRIVDGREAVTFLRRVKSCVEAPVRMLLEV